MKEILLCWSFPVGTGGSKTESQQNWYIPEVYHKYHCNLRQAQLPWKELACLTGLVEILKRFCRFPWTGANGQIKALTVCDDLSLKSTQSWKRLICKWKAELLPPQAIQIDLHWSGLWQLLIPQSFFEGDGVATPMLKDSVNVWFN